jgi:hypothetical protein
LLPRTLIIKMTPGGECAPSSGHFASDQGVQVADRRQGGAEEQEVEGESKFASFAAVYPDRVRSHDPVQCYNVITLNYII